jgi:UPF0176 protein
MKNRGFKEVYQIEGGIVRYAEQYRDTGLWEGSLYVFDNRLKLEYGKEELLLGECDFCSGATNSFYNCRNLACRTRILVCNECTTDDEPLCINCR